MAHAEIAGKLPIPEECSAAGLHYIYSGQQGRTSSESMEIMLTARRAVFSTTPNQGAYAVVGLHDTKTLERCEHTYLLAACTLHGARHLKMLLVQDRSQDATSTCSGEIKSAYLA